MLYAISGFQSLLRRTDFKPTMKSTFIKTDVANFQKKAQLGELLSVCHCKKLRIKNSYNKCDQIRRKHGSCGLGHI